jgi:putative transposase
VIVAYIEGHKDRFGVEPICRVLSEHGMKIAPSTYYAALTNRVSAADLSDAYLTNTLVDFFRKHRRVYGIRKLWHEMRRTGHDLGRDQVARLMRIAGIEGVVRGKHTTTTTRRGDQNASRHPDLIKRAWDDPTRPDQWWVADFTYSAQPVVMCSSGG